mmetsp:Transcript_6325/g.17681  ORF Transcript_6325/g.17681 Transcript_6325/m.17681 type:complete len:143 (+) Transcript_6325:1695-2123(+)
MYKLQDKPKPSVLFLKRQSRNPPWKPKVSSLSSCPPLRSAVSEIETMFTAPPPEYQQLYEAGKIESATPSLWGKMLDKGRELTLAVVSNISKASGRRRNGVGAALEEAREDVESGGNSKNSYSVHGGNSTSAPPQYSYIAAN